MTSKKIKQHLNVHYFKKEDKKIICSNCNNEQLYKSMMINKNVVCNKCRKKNKVINKQNVFFETFLNMPNDQVYFISFFNGRVNFHLVHFSIKGQSYIKNIKRRPLSSEFTFDKNIPVKKINRSKITYWGGNKIEIHGGFNRGLIWELETDKRHDYEAFIKNYNFLKNYNNYLKPKEIRSLIKLGFYEKRILNKRNNFEFEKIFKQYPELLSYYYYDNYNVLEKFNKQELNFIIDIKLNLEEIIALEEFRKLNYKKLVGYIKRKNEKLLDEKISKRKKNLLLLESKIQNEKLCIKLPDNCKDFDEEKYKMKNCINGYKERHAKGYSTILFVRLKKFPEKSLIDVEIKEGKINQFLGYNNNEVKSKKAQELKELIEKEFKKIKREKLC